MRKAKNSSLIQWRLFASGIFFLALYSSIVLLKVLPSAPVAAPQPQWIAYTAEGECPLVDDPVGCPIDMVLLDPQTGATRTLSIGATSTMAWSPDYRHLAYNCIPNLCTIDINTEEILQLSYYQDFVKGYLNWSPDGKFIAFTDYGFTRLLSKRHTPPICSH